MGTLQAHGAPTRASSLAGLDDDLPRPRLGGLRQQDREQAISHSGLDPVGINRVAELEAPAERATATLAVDDLAVGRGLLGLGLALASNGEHALMHRDLHIVGGVAGHLGGELEALVLLD